MDPKKSKNSSPRIKVIQKLYNALMNPDALIEYPKSQYKKFIKDVVTGTLERSDLIEDQIKSFLVNDINLVKTDKLLKIILFAAIFELMFKHNTPKKVIINEYLLASEHFLEKIQIGYLNAILDKISKELRKDVPSQRRCRRFSVGPCYSNNLRWNIKSFILFFNVV